MNRLFTKPNLNLSRRLFFLVLILSSIGLAVVFEASGAEALAKFGNSFYFIRQQLQWVLIGLVTLIITSFIPSKIWKVFAPIFYASGIILLIAVLIPNFGVEVKGAARWLDLGFIRFQPVEVMKMGVVAFFASWMTKHQRLGPFLTFMLIPVVLLMLQPDLGSTLIIVGISLGMFVAAGGEMTKIWLLLAAGILAICLLIIFSPYRRDRIKTFLDPSSDPLGSSYHIRQITIALGNGFWFGQGIGQSRQKYQYIPEVSTDSIFAIVAEETGFVGSVALIALLLYFTHTCFTVAQTLPSHSFEQLFATGLVIWIAGQIVLNLAAVVALVPLTGVPLPFISRGGTSLVTIMGATGILISLARRSGK